MVAYTKQIKTRRDLEEALHELRYQAEWCLPQGRQITVEIHQEQISHAGLLPEIREAQASNCG